MSILHIVIFFNTRICGLTDACFIYPHIKVKKSHFINQYQSYDNFKYIKYFYPNFTK